MKRSLVPPKYVDYCEEEDALKLPPGLFYHYHITRWLSYTCFPRFQSGKFQVELDAEKSRQKHKEDKTSIEVNSITEPLYRNLAPHLQADFHVWMQQMDGYLSSLSTRDKFALLAMTRFSQFHVQEWLLEDSCRILHGRLASWNRLTKMRGYLPIFFPLLDRIDAGEMENVDMQKWRRLRRVRSRYRFVLEHILPTLSYEDTVACVAALAEQVLAILRGAPPTKCRLLLYRGVKVDHMPGKAFVSTSLDPFHTLRYMEKAGGGPCCLMRILVPRGSHLLFLAGFSSFEGEQEFLLPPARYHKTREDTVLIPDLEQQHGKNRCPQRGRRVRILDLIMR